MPSRKVVVFGGSYPGALSAWFRVKYPHMSVASIASSAVVYPIADLWRFDYQVYKDALNSSASCAQTIHDINMKIEQVILTNSSNASMAIEKAGGSTEMDAGDFAYYFADKFVSSVQYG